MNKKKLDKYFDSVKETQIETIETHAAVTLAANGSSEISIPIPSSYDFIVKKISGKQTGTYSLKIISTGDEFPFSNKALHSTAFVGNGNIPYELPQPFLLKKRGGLRIEVADLSGAQNTIQIQLHGFAVYNQKISKDFESKYAGYYPYFYTTDNTFSVGTTDTDATMSITKDFDFLCTKVSQFNSNSSTGLQMKIQHSSGNPMQNNEYIDVNTIMGNAQYPKEFVSPTLFNAGTVVTLTAKDTVANTLYIVFGGISRRVKVG